MGNQAFGLNEMASDYIFSMNEKDMEDIQCVTKCNKLIKLIAKRIEENASLAEIKKVHSQMHSKYDLSDASTAIAIFYVKIAHVYGSIMQTLNPTMGKKDELPEIDMLYNDFNYDMESGEFKGRSKKMDKLYNAHLETFYRAFTGEPTMDYKVKTFSDIPVTLHAKKFQPHCDEITCLVEKYATNLSNGIHSASEAYEKLMSILDEMFLDKSIHPDLTETKLTNIVSRVRKIIVDLYIERETNYAKGVQIYEALSNKILLETLKGQQTELMNQRILLKIK